MNQHNQNIVVLTSTLKLETEKCGGKVLKVEGFLEQYFQELFQFQTPPRNSIFSWLSNVAIQQESGRAGRDDQKAHCIVYWRLSDLFRLSTMVFTEQTGLDNLYAMMAYCLDTEK